MLDMPLALTIVGTVTSISAVVIVAIKTRTKKQNGNNGKYVTKETCIVNIQRLEAIVKGQTAVVTEKVESLEKAVNNMVKFYSKN